MKISSKSHQFGETILKEHFSAEYRELVSTLESTAVPRRDAGPFNAGGTPPKRQWRRIQGQRRRILLPADMKQLNKVLDAALRKEDWKRQPVASGQTFGTARVKLRGDFEKNGVFVEVEFGNSASLFRDLFKFQVANRERVGEVGVLITAKRQLMKFHDSGVTSYELATGLLPYLALSVQMPVWVIGLEPDDWSPIQVRYEEMVAAVAGREDCHSWDTIWGTQLAVETVTANERDGLVVDEDELLE